MEFQLQLRKRSLTSRSLVLTLHCNRNGLWLVILMGRGCTHILSLKFTSWSKLLLVHIRRGSRVVQEGWSGQMIWPSSLSDTKSPCCILHHHCCRWLRNRAGRDDTEQIASQLAFTWKTQALICDLCTFYPDSRDLLALRTSASWFRICLSIDCIRSEEALEVYSVWLELNDLKYLIYVDAMWQEYTN